MAAERMVAVGLAMSSPVLAGDEPWMGSYMPVVPCSVLRSPSEAEGSMPREPASTEASSERMSPNMLPVTMTSNEAGLVMSDMAVESTSRCSSSMSG